MPHLLYLLYPQYKISYRKSNLLAQDSFLLNYITLFFKCLSQDNSKELGVTIKSLLEKSAE